MRISSGSYTGNNTDDTNIAGVGFQPDLVIIKGDTTQFAVWRSSTMDADSTAYFGPATANLADAIQSFGVDGFQIGANAVVNSNGIVYYFIAIRDNGAGDFHVGTYDGDGNDNRNVTGVGFTPTIFWTKAETARNGMWRCDQHSGDDSSFFSNSANAANMIQSLIADGFQLGSSVNVNENGITYHYVAFNDVVGFCNAGTYTGNATDDRSITGAGFQPNFVLVKGNLSTGGHSYMKIDKMDAADSGSQAAVTPTTNRIQAIEADGFQIGTGTEVNTDTLAYYWFALRNGVSPFVPVMPKRQELSALLRM